jgi:hypothetical protein
VHVFCVSCAGMCCVRMMHVYAKGYVAIGCALVVDVCVFLVCVYLFAVAYMFTRACMDLCVDCCVYMRVHA